MDVAPEDGTEPTLVATTADLAGFDYERNTAFLDMMFRTIELDRPGPEDLVAACEGGGTPFDGSGFTVLGSDGDTVSIGVSS